KGDKSWLFPPFAIVLSHGDPRNLEEPSSKTSLIGGLDSVNPFNHLEKDFRSQVFCYGAVSCTRCDIGKHPWQEVVIECADGLSFTISGMIKHMIDGHRSITSLIGGCTLGRSPPKKHGLYLSQL